MSSIFSIESNLKLKLKDYFLVHVAFAEESQSTYWLLPSSMEYLIQQRQKKNLKGSFLQYGIKHSISTEFQPVN